MFEGLCTDNLVEEKRKLSVFGTLESSKAYLLSLSRLDGKYARVFTTGFIHMLDVCIVTNNLYVLSKEQETFFKRFLTEAESGTLSDDMLQFDEYLASYIGD